MSGEIQFTVTEKDNVEAVHTHTGRVFRWASWFLLGVSFLFPLIDLLAGLPIREDTAFFIFFGLALLFIAGDFTRDWLVRRAYRQSAPMRSPVRISWDAESIRIDTDWSNARFLWNQFFRWMASKKSLLLYCDSMTFIPLPRRALPEEAFEEIVAALRAAGVRERGIFSRSSPARSPDRPSGPRPTSD